MKISGNVVLITGGSSGIGLALTERFLSAGNEVIITGRREALLQEVATKLPNVTTLVSDSGSAAAIHSFTMSLRHQVRKTPLDVVEVIPPAVHSNLGGSYAFGVPTDEYADSVMAQLAEGRSEITYQFSAQGSQASRAELDAIFARMNP